MIPLNDKRVLVTGATGFLGSHLMRVLKERYPTARLCGLRGPGRRDGNEYAVDLTGDIAPMKVAETCHRLLGGPPNVVFHLAAKVAGIGGNTAAPYEFFSETMRMGINVIDLCSRWGARLVFVGSVCSYPNNLRMDVGGQAVPLNEYDDFFRGHPNATNAPYGIAKRALWTACEAAREQFGALTDFSYVYLVPANLIGPGDHFFDDDDRRHVAAAVIDKMHKATMAADPEVVLWGTGAPTRDLLYVEDCVEGLIAAAERFDFHRAGKYPVNLATGIETPIVVLAQMVSQIVGFKGRVMWDANYPDGQARRVYDTKRAYDQLGWSATTPVYDALQKSYADYLKRLP